MAPSRCRNAARSSAALARRMYSKLRKLASPQKNSHFLTMDDFNSSDEEYGEPIKPHPKAGKKSIER
jgi:hypothetical protein